MEWLRKHVIHQLRYPSGLGGRLLLHQLNRENAPMNQLAIASLPLQPEHHILEIGFGGGDLISQLFVHESRLQITGVDLSPEAVRFVQKRFRSAIARGHLQIHQAAAENIPHSSHTFDSVVSVNTLYFWHDLNRVLAESWRLLKPGGHIAIAYNSKQFLVQNQLTQHGFHTYERAEVEATLKFAGFKEINTISGYSSQNGTFYCSSGSVQSARTTDE